MTGDPAETEDWLAPWQGMGRISNNDGNRGHFQYQAAGVPKVYGHVVVASASERGNMVKPGFLRENEQPYEVYVRGITAATREMLEVHSQRFKSSRSD